jgi:hypothetical protein
VLDIQLTAGHWNQTGVWTGGDFWALTGNAGTAPAANFLGTSDNQPLVIKTNGAEAMRIYGNGQVSIGGVSPSARLHVDAGSDNISVWGQSNSTDGRGVVGHATSATGVNYGVYGVGESPVGYAGYFYGRVHVNGALSKASGSFKIDHPIGGWAPLFVAEEVQDNAFKIAGGEPGMRVSWQVTRIRQDAWANDHRIPVEEDKPADEKGAYLYPQGYGQPESMGLDYQRNADLLK